MARTLGLTMMVDEQELQADLRICGKEKKLVNELVTAIGTEMHDVGMVLAKKPSQTIVDGINFSRATAPKKKVPLKKKQQAIAEAREKERTEPAVLPLKTIFADALRV